MRADRKLTKLVAFGAVAVWSTAVWCVLMAQAAVPRIRLETRVLGQDQWLAGSNATVRVITADHLSGSPVAGAPVRISLAEKDSKDFETLFNGRTNGKGTIEASFAVPEKREGNYVLRVVAEGMGEKDEATSDIRIKRLSRVLLTTDKPIYQPSQIIHIRALALQIPSLQPVAGQPCLIEVMDSKGNKVLKKTQDLSKFGVAGTDFQLANEINQGEYTIRAVVGKDEVEKKVTVKRYVLPKFKVRFETGRKFYLPGETVKGTIHADYFFGKPVDGGKVNVKLAKFDVGFNDFAEITGDTDASGTFEFEQKLPDAFAGQPLEQGDAFFKAEVKVTDGADHTETVTAMVPVAKDPIKILVVPEGGQLIPGVDNVLYIIVSYPDGSPVEHATVGFQKDIKPGQYVDQLLQTVKMDGLGMGQARVRPSAGTLDILVSAHDDQGHRADLYQTLGVQNVEESVLLRTDKAVAAVGQELRLTVLSSQRSGYVYVDAVKDGQTVLTRTLPFAAGAGSMELPLTADMAGTLEVHAYRISRTGNIIRDTRTVYVQPADEMRIKVTADRGQYLPGGPAKLDFTVTDRRGRGLAAALGVSIVDESVYALQELQPGLERIYFMLEKELAEPKFEIHGITPGDIVRPVTGEKGALEPGKQQAAKALFAAVQKEKLEAATPVFTLNQDSYAAKIEKAREELAKRAKADCEAVARAIRAFYQASPKANLDELGGIHYLVREGKLPKSVLTDEWGRAYEFQASPWGGYRQGLAMRSTGPDGRKGNVDDIVVRSFPEAQQDPQLIANARVWEEEEDKAKLWFDGLGGFGGGINRRGLGMEVPAAADAAVLDAVVTGDLTDKAVVFARSSSSPAEGGRPQVRVREFFPETLYFNPAVITDDRGRASVTLDMADSITSWRLTAMGSSLNGLLGSTTQGIKVFQDFFIDIDLPVALTQNDEVSVPIAVYNYLPKEQKVELVLTKEPWFELEGTEKQVLQIEANQVRAVHYRLKVKQIGWHKLTVHAYGSKMNDAIRREIEVVPDGQRFDDSINDRLEKDVTRTVTIPASAIDGASNILVKVYPGIFSQVVEGMDSLLRMPFGCFEQTSSATYPNVLVLGYLRSTKQSTPEVQMKAEQYINLGYQRLLSYEVPGGGFEWFGNAPANQVLTAYGLLEFSDMSKVYEVDPAVIERTQKWLVSKQAADGTWTPDKGGIAEGAINRQTDDFRTTAYVLWALASSGESGGAVSKGLSYLTANWSKVDDPYALALAANAFLASPDGKSKCIDMCQKLADLRQKDERGVYWTTKGNTAVSSTGQTADIETTALAALALAQTGRYNDIVTDALTFLIKSKDPHGTWGSTQATIFSLKALISSMENRTQEINADVTVLVNGKEAGSFKITPENSDVLRQVDCKKFIQEGDNKVEIRFSGKGSSLFQIRSYYYLPWVRGIPARKKEMEIDVSYDRTQLDANDVVTSTVTVAFNGLADGRNGTANMVIVDLGTPPGFEVMAEDLEQLVKDKTFQKYSLTGRQAIIYIEKVESGKPLTFKYRLKAKFPIRAKTPESVVYQYYNPEARGVAAPVEMVVR